MTPGETDKPQLVGGELLAAISKMIVSILREHYGRGPMKAKTYVMDDLVVCLLRNGFIAIEETMMQQGLRKATTLRPVSLSLAWSGQAEWVRRRTVAEVLTSTATPDVQVTAD